MRSMMKRLAAIVVVSTVLLGFAGQSQAGLIATLSKSGENRVMLTLEGSGTTSRYVGDPSFNNIGNYANSPSIGRNYAVNSNFGSLFVQSIYVDNDFFSADDFGIRVSPNIGSGYDLSGISGSALVGAGFLAGNLLFSQLSVGTYTSNSSDARRLGGFELRVVDSPVAVPEPSSLALAGLGLGLLGFTGRRRRNV